MLSVEGVKGIVLTGLFLMTFIISLIPVKIVNAWKKRTLESSVPERGITPSDEQVLHPMFKRVISLLSCFAAGVFLATCFLDLLPGVRRTMVHVLYRLNIYTGFPMSEFVMVFGFFLILIVEQIVLTYKEGKITHKPTNSNRNDVTKPLLTNEMEDDIQSEHSLTGIRDESTQEEYDHNILTSSDSHSHAHNHDIPHSSLRSVILLIALSMHSVFEGLAVGLQKTSGDVIGIFSALILHKSILGFSLGLNLVQSKLSQSIVIRSVLIFSVSAPFGVGIGMGIINLWDSTMSSLVQGLLSGIATGTFLYVTFFEVLPHEFNAHDDRLLKTLFLILGYGTVTGILFLSDDIKKPFCAVEDNLNTGT